MSEHERNTVIPTQEVLDRALTSAVRAALPLAVVGAGPVAAIGIHMDTYYGSAGLYVLPTAAAAGLPEHVRDELGDWPISTDWDLDAYFARAFSSYWQAMGDLVRDLSAQLSEEQADDLATRLMRAACVAIRALEEMDPFPAERAEGFRCLVVDHDEPASNGAMRYARFLATGEVMATRS
ncbi:MAG: hypothetical protein R3B40_28700 [Polyangiales bacterium]